MNGLKRASVALATAGLLASGVAQAKSLYDLGGGMIYDPVLKITWLADANYAKTSGYDTDGLMDWTAANAWAASLTVGGFTDWRLPTALNQDGSGPCEFFNCTNSEMGHMFYNNLGASAGSSILAGTKTANLALFTNLQDDIAAPYWSGTAAGGTNFWNFYTYDGYQTFDDKDYEFYAWAVRPVDLGAPIPEPETYAMLLAGLGLLGVVAKRRRRSFAAS